MSFIRDNRYEELFLQSNLFEWETIKKCNNKNVQECANIICQLITNFNGTANFIQNILTRQNEYETKITKLEEQNKKLEKCNNCSVLKKKLDDHNEKIQTLAHVFGQITNSNGQSEKSYNSKSDLDRVHNMFTEIIEDIPSQRDGELLKESMYGKRKLKLSKENMKSDSTQNIVMQRCEDILGYETPKKKIRITRQSPPKSATKSDTQESVTSPILVKTKRNINNSFGENNKSPLANLSNRLADKMETAVVSSPTMKKRKDGEKDGKESSPSLLGKLSDVDKTPSPEIIKHIKQESEEDPEDKRRSLSLLQADKPGKKENVKTKRSPKCMKLKQARLSFSKAKTREPLDVSMANNFCGGMRRFSVDNVLTKDDEDEMLKIALQLSLNESMKLSPGNYDNDDDVIDASPANQSKPTLRQKTHKVQVHRAETPVIKKIAKGSGDSTALSDNEETMIFDSQEAVKKQRSPSKKKRQEGKCSTASTSKCETASSSRLRESSKTSPKKLTRSNNSPLVDEPEYAYVEPVLRKKVDKKNVQGWGCKKCKDFYEVAFEGDERMIKEKMNECSRHRGKFNPIRMDTPAGFWDLKMPPTQDTEAFNRRNNRS